MDKRFASYLLVFFCFAIYDSGIDNMAASYSVNLTVFFYCAMYGFMAYDIYLTVRSTRDVLKQLILIDLSGILFLRIFLALSSIGHTWKEYMKINNNSILDYRIWLVIFLLTCILLWVSRSHLQPY